MPLSLSDIELLKRIAADLREWANKPDDELLPDTTYLPENKAFLEAGYQVTDIPALKPFNRVMEALRFHKPSVAESVQELYEILMDGMLEVYRLIKAGRKDLLRISILRDAAVVLADELQHVAQMAREELVAEKAAETEQKIKSGKELSKVSKGKRVEEGEYDSCTWDEPLIQEQIKRIEEKFGPLANTLSELAELVREVDRWRNKPDPDHRDHPYKIVDATTIELLTSNVGDTFVFVPCEIYNVVICALTSARRLRPQIEMVVGTKDAAKFYYEELAQAVTFGANIHQTTESIMISLENGGKAESVAQTLEQWDRNLLLLTRLDAKDSKQEIKPDKESKIKSRPTKPEMENRNRAVAMAAAKIKAEYDRLPTVDEIIAKTKYTRNQIYATNTYKEGKIAKSSAKLTTEMTGSSVAESEQFSRISEQHSRADRRSKSEQDELNALIDRQKK